jgi:hypothetical protein
MTKQSGLGDMLLFAGVNVSGDTGSLSAIRGGHAVQEVPGINASAQERVGLLRDGALEWSSWFNPANAHLIYNDLPTVDAMVTYGRGTALGSPGACLIGKQIGYDGQRGADGSLAFSLSALANGYGIEWGEQLTAGERTDTGATNGTSVDFAQANAFGLQAYLQVTAFTGTDVTITIQQSSDNAVGDPFAAVTGGAFTAVTAFPTTQRIQTARDQAVERYLRVVTSTSGGFTSVTFNVVVVVNTATVVF